MVERKKWNAARMICSRTQGVHRAGDCYRRTEQIVERRFDSFIIAAILTTAKALFAAVRDVFRGAPPRSG